MQSKSFLLAALMLSLTLSVSCSPRRHAGATDANAPAPAGMSGNDPKNGTADSGGGHLFKGKPLESYIKDITQLPAYQKHVEPIWKKIGKDGETMVYFLFRYVITQKTWYFLPGDLDKIPEDKIGAVVKTDQGALQDFDQVWMDSRAFDAMSEEDQGKLILHEIFMGIKLLKFDSPKKQAFAIAFSAKSYMGKPETPKGKPSDVAPQDYAEVRASVDEVWSNYTNWSHDDWGDLFWRKNFKLPNLVFRSKDSEGPITVKEIQERLITAQYSKKWPQYFFSGKSLLKENPNLIEEQYSPKTLIKWKASGPCEFSISVEKDNTIQFEIEADGQKINQKAYFYTKGSEDYYEPSLDSLRYWDVEWWGKAITQISFRIDRSKNKYGLDAKFYEVKLNFSNYDLWWAEVNERVCTNSDCSSYVQTSNGVICSSADTITIKN